MNSSIHSDDAMQMMVNNMKVLGIDPSLFVEFLAADLTDADAVTVGAFITDVVMPSLKKGQRVTYAPYAKLVIHGYPKLCSCFCARCLQSFKGDSSWSPCACVTAGICTCRKADLHKGEAETASCLEECAGLGDQQLGTEQLTDWEILARWAQMRAQKRTEVRNRKRSDEGLPTFDHDGRGAAEALIAFGNQLYRLAAGNKIRGVERHLLEDVNVKPRVDIVARAYTIDQLQELWQAIFTSGSDDAELDMLIVWLILETGSRRGGAINLTVGDLLFAAGMIRLSEKDGKVDKQPVTNELLQVLLSHALERGDILISKPHDLDIAEITIDHVINRVVKLRTNERVPYYKKWAPLTEDVVGTDGRTKKVRLRDEQGELIYRPHPITRKRFHTLWGRLKRELPWLAEAHGRPHDLRKTMGTFVERAFGHAVASAWLRHKVVGTTEGYTVALRAEVEAAHAWLVGEQRSTG
jgi:integrase